MDKKTTLKEHKKDVRKNSGNLSIISCHRLETSHEFDWENTKILDHEQSYNKRLISEMIHIKKNKISDSTNR